MQVLDPVAKLYRKQREPNFESHHRTHSRMDLTAVSANFGMYGPPQTWDQSQPPDLRGAIGAQEIRSENRIMVRHRRGAPPRLGSAEFQQTVHFGAVSEMAQTTGLKPSTARGYQSAWNHLVRFCDHESRKYNPWLPECAPELFLLFASYLYLKDDNLTIDSFATAFNYAYRNQKLPEVWKGGLITQTINAFNAANTARAGRGGRKIARLRVSLPTPGLIRTLINFERFLNEKKWHLCMLNAMWISMLLCLLRADTTGGFLPGDIYFNAEGFMMITVRQVKCGSAHIQPFTKSIPPPPAGNSIALKTFELMKRAVDLSADPNCPAELSAAFTDSDKKGKAARVITEFVQSTLPAREIGIADGSFCASHSARITGANHCMYSARANYTTLRRWGGWKSEPAMQGYIDHETVRCKIWGDFYYWLKEDYTTYEFDTGPNGYDGTVEIMGAFA